ncbi:MAG: glycine zipper 2TM domain-containing protein [Acidibrevibacterium sp.]|uniref:glycine zipper 2TM domain-containing protein n=1 Tax=Acidibrevibacterium sp. TaxID=2606776 RepID=UPI003D050B05
MRTFTDLSWRLVIGLLALGGLVLTTACTGTPANSTYSGYGVGRTAYVTYGTIVSMRNVVVQGGDSGVGTIGGAALGGVAGSFIGGNSFRGNLLGAVGGALLGGLVGNTAESELSKGNAVEFIIRQDDGQTISVVQTNENNFRPGQRVAIIRGDRTRLAPIYG